MSVPARPSPLGKLSPPRLGRVFDRDRLFSALDRWRDSPAIWIGAAPGAGKSTLVATWLKRRRRSTLWLQVDPGDRDPATFVQSFDALIVESLKEPIALPPFSLDDLSDLRGWLSRRLRLLLHHLPAPWVLVLDNHQELPPDSELQIALAQLLTELPAGVQWIFISREAPPPTFVRPLARQQLTVLDADSLRFDDMETLELVRLHGRPDALAEALRAANGWAGGMTLMLAGARSGAPLPGIEARKRLFDYFAGEVLGSMPEPEQAALGAIAMLPSATARMAVELSGLSTAGELLERLTSISLFIDRREGATTAYVFHALFREFLCRYFEQAQGAQQARNVRRRAGLLLVDAGQIDAGLALLLEAEEWTEAIAVLESAATAFVAAGRTYALKGFIDLLPVGPRQRLAYWRGYCALDANPAGALADLEHAFEAAVRAHDVMGQLAAASAACTALVSTNRLKQIDRWIAVLDAHAASAAQLQPETIEMRVVPGLLAALVYRAPWHPLADSMASRAERLLHQDSASGQRLLLGSLAFHLLWRGHLDRLERIVSKVDALCGEANAAPVTMMRWWGVGILVKALLGQYESARRDVELALALVGREPSVHGQRAGIELLGMIVAIASCDAVSARRHMHEAMQWLHPDNAVDLATYEQQRAVLALHEDDLPTARRLTQSSVASARIGGFPMREHIALITSALAAARSDEPALAEQALEEVFSHPFYADCRWHHWVVGIVAAYAALRRNDRLQALLHLRGALGVARECGFRHGPMLVSCGDMMARLSALALEHDIEPEIARDLVIRNHLKAPPEAGESWPWAVRVHTFGALRVELSDGPLKSGRKESRRLLELLGLLVAHGAAPVPQHRIADELWPDAEGDAALNALDNALHRLRRMLGGDDRILLRQGMLSLNRQRCWTDVLALEAQLSHLEGCTATDAEPALAALRRLYQSPLLPGWMLGDIVERRRAIHQRMVRTLQSVAAARAASTGSRLAGAKQRPALGGSSPGHRTDALIEAQIESFLDGLIESLPDL